LGEPHHHEVRNSAFAIGLASIFAVACATRFYALSQPPLWMDEAYSYFVSTRPLADIVFNKVDNHPPLFYAIQHLWTLVDPNIAAFRIPVAAVGILTVLVVALATSDLVNRRAGLAAGALLAMSAGHIYFSQDARMYSLLAFGLAIATWGLVGFVERKRPQLYLTLYLVGGAIAIY
jgi:mannosyltransferase